MEAEDVTDTLELALETSGIETARVVHRPRLLSDNGSSYLSADVAKWLDDRKMQHVRGAPYHPMTQDKIERWHQTLKNRVRRRGPAVYALRKMWEWRFATQNLPSLRHTKGC